MIELSLLFFACFHGKRLFPSRAMHFLGYPTFFLKDYSSTDHERHNPLLHP